jgi:hypothetical protein
MVDPILYAGPQGYAWSQATVRNETKRPDPCRTHALGEEYSRSWDPTGSGRASGFNSTSTLDIQGPTEQAAGWSRIKRADALVRDDIYEALDRL